MEILNKIVLLVLFVFNGAKVFSQQGDMLITPAQMKEDTDFYFKKLYEIHPNPYCYYSSMEFEYMRNSIYARINKAMTYEQFAWILGEVNAYVDAHSQLNFYPCMDKRGLFNGLSKENRIFPNVQIKDGRVYLKKGDFEIEEINGVSAADIIKEEKKYFNWKLPHEQNIHKMEEFFSIFIDSKYDIVSPFRVKFKGKEEVKLVEGYAVERYLRESADGIRGWVVGHRYPYRIYPFSSVAIFSITDFSEQSEEVLMRDLDDFIKLVNDYKIRNVFYDLTKNEGGSFHTLHAAAKALDVISHGFVSLRYVKVDDSGKQQVNEEVLPSNASENNIQERMLYILQGINTLSTGDYFCRMVAENKLGILVGQNTGEPTVAYSCTQGNYATPNSKISFTVATALLDFSEYFDTETLHPDVYWDVNHNRNFTEEELMKIVEACEKGRSN